MYPISSAVKALFDSEQRQVLRITGTDRNGSAINITEANVMENGFNIDRYSCNGKKLEIGTAIASELTLRLDNRQGQFNNVIFEGAELFVEIGVADWTQADPVVTYIPCGYFTPDEQPRRLSAISLNAMDRMTRFDIVLYKSIPWTDNLGNIITDNLNNPFYFNVALGFPASIANLIGQICMIADVPLGTDLSQFPGYDYVLTAMPEFDGDVTFRNLIQWCAGLMGTNAWIDWTGSLRFSWYDNETNYVMTTANRFNSDLYENDIQITGVQFQDTDEAKTLYLAGVDTYTLDLTGNPLINGTNAADVLNNIYEIVHNYTYRPFTATVVTAPYLWPMDRVTFTDRDGGGHVSLLTNVNLTVNGNTQLASSGETAALNGMASPSGFTPGQSNVLQNIRRVSNADLNDAVNRATATITGANGGFVRFIYDTDEDGNTVMTEIVIMDTDDIETAKKVWRWNSGGFAYSESGYNGTYTTAITQDGEIVADFITAGKMSANVIRAGLLTDTYQRNYWDLDRGIFRLSGNATLDDRPVSQLLQDIDATITNVDVEFAQNQSPTIPPTDGWTTEAPPWAAGYYIWQRTVTTTPSGTNYSEPVCISGRDGSESTPGLNQATIMLYKRSAAQPDKPSVNTVYTFTTGVLSPLPDGWTRGIPNGTDPCWVTSASAISTDTSDNIPASEWLTPTKFAENGENGSSIDTIVNYYAISATTEPPADTEFWTPGVAVPWMDNFGNVITAGSSGDLEFMPPEVPVPTEIDPYVWRYQLTTYTDGSTVRSNKEIVSVIGRDGVGIEQIIEQYYLSTSNQEQIGGEWSTEQPAWESGLYIWTRTVVTWTNGNVTETDPMLAKAINGANESANDAVNLANKAIDNTSNLDASLNQAGVFYRLTNGGTEQGIYLENHKLYINGTYIKAGTIEGSYIAANTITITQFSEEAKSALIIGTTVKTQYFLSTSTERPEGDGETWSDGIKSWQPGRYLWTRTATTKTYANGNSATTYMPSENGAYDYNLTFALMTASSAQASANARINTYYQASQPTDGLTTGDLWIDTDDGNKLYRWNGSAWVDVQDDAIQSALEAAGDAQATADSKIITFCQPNQPTATDVGDLWIDTDDGNKLYRWNGTEWQNVQDTAIADAARLASQAQTTANSKITTSYQNDAPTASAIGDLWIDTNDDNKLYRWNGSQWIDAQDKEIQQALTAAGDAQATADGKIATFAQDSQPAISESSTGDLWIDTNDGNKLYRFDGTTWVSAQDGAIQNVANLANGAVKSVVSVFFRSTSSTPPSRPTQATVIGTATDRDGVWSYNMPIPRNGKYFYTCEQYNYVDLKVAYSDVKTLTTLDYTSKWCSATDSTQIDGSAIFAGSITADKIAAGSITVTQLSKDVEDSIIDAQDTANGAIYRQQRIYCSTASGSGDPIAPTTWVTTASNIQNNWTTVRPVYSSSYPVLFTAIQRQTMEQFQDGLNECSTTPAEQDYTTTVIDGGHITTGTIDASVVNVTNIKAGNITSGYISADRIQSRSLSADKIFGGTLRLGGSNNVNGTLEVYNASGTRVVLLNNTGARINGTMITEGTDAASNPVSVKMDQGKVQCLFGTTPMVELGYEPVHQTFALRPSGNMSNVYIDAITTSGSGSSETMVGGSSLSLNKTGRVDLVCDSLYVSSATTVPEQGQTTQEILVGNGWRLRFTNGILTYCGT